MKAISRYLIIFLLPNWQFSTRMGKGNYVIFLTKKNENGASNKIPPVIIIGWHNIVPREYLCHPTCIPVWIISNKLIYYAVDIEFITVTLTRKSGFMIKLRAQSSSAQLASQSRLLTIIPRRCWARWQNQRVRYHFFL